MTPRARWTCLQFAPLAQGGLRLPQCSGGSSPLRGSPSASSRVRFATVLHALAILLLVLQSGCVRAQRPADSQSVRSGQPLLQELIREGQSRSETFASLVTRIEQTDGMVYVEQGSCPLPGTPGCLLHWVSDVGGRRYLRIYLNLTHAPHDQLIATLGHELQHALEVLSAPKVRTTAGVRTLFMRIGSSAGRGSGETAEAVHVGEQVASELARSTSTLVAQN